MTYALIVNGTAVRTYPYSFALLRKDNPQVSYPENPTDEKLAEFNVHFVKPTVRPAVPLTQNVIETLPILVDGKWTQAWAIIAASAEEIAARQRDATDTAADTAVKADAFVANFISMTPAQVDAYVENNTATLPATRALLKKMAIMLLILARRGLRD